MNMTAATRREIAALLLILAAGLLLAGWYHTRANDTTPRDTYRVVWHQPGAALEPLGDRVCVASGRPGFVTCTDVDPQYPCLLKHPTGGAPFVACGMPRDNTLDDAPEEWSR